LYNNILVQILILLYNPFMVRKMGKKQVKIFLSTYFILALIGSSAISAGEAFRFEYSNNDNLSSGTYFSSVGHTIDWLAGVTIRKAKSNSNSPLRNRLLRVFTFAETIAIATYLVRANLKVKNDNIIIIKNLVPLKLRI